MSQCTQGCNTTPDCSTFQRGNAALCFSGDWCQSDPDCVGQMGCCMSPGNTPHSIQKPWETLASKKYRNDYKYCFQPGLHFFTTKLQDGNDPVRDILPLVGRDYNVLAKSEDCPPDLY